MNEFLTSRPASSRAPRASRVLRCVAAALALVAAACTDQSPVTPGSPLAPGHSRLSVAPSFQTMPAGGPRITLSRARGLLIGANGDTTAVEASFAGDSAVLTFDVSFPGASATYTLDLTEFDTDGQVAFHAVQQYTLHQGDNTDVPQPVLVYAAPDASVTALHLTPSAGLVLDAGTVGQLAASGTNASNQAVSPLRVGWTSSDAGVATVDANGVVHAGAFQGEATISAQTATGVSASVPVHVHAPVDHVTIAPGSLDVVRGLTGAAAAELRDAGNHLIDDRAPTWTSSDPTVATVSQFGVVQGIKLGTATITASAEGKSASIPVHVLSPVDHLQLSATSLTFASLNESQTLSAQLVPKTGASVSGISVTFESANPSVATVSNDGVVTAKHEGTTTVTATADGISATAAVTVHQVAVGITISPKVAGVTALGATQPFTAQAKDALGSPVPAASITWTSSNPSVATVDANGVATGQATGETTITATVGDKSDAASFSVSQVPRLLFVNADRSEIQIGETAHLSARTADANGNTIGDATPTWTTTTPNLVSVSGSSATGLAIGAAVLSARMGDLTAQLGIQIVANPALGGVVTGQIVDAATGSGIGGATVTVGSTSVTTGSNGAFTLTSIPSGSNLVLSASGHVSTTYFNVATGAQPTALGPLPLAPISELTGSFSGRIVDAVTGLSVPFATVRLRSGINATAGTTLLETESDQAGNLMGSLSPGTYTATVSASGYATSTQTFPVVGGVALSNQNVVLSPSGLSNNQYRIILQWGQNPPDLDSHLVGPTADGSMFEIAYYSRTYYENDQLVASLDQDFTEGFGPETVTLNQTRAGQYHYSVHLYCCGTSFGHARVTVYRGSQVAGRFTAPADTGEVWNVFNIDGATGALTSVNTITGYSAAYTRHPASPVFNRIPSRTRDAIAEMNATAIAHIRAHPKPKR